MRGSRPALTRRRAITEIAPYGSLIQHGAKWIEARSWKAPDAAIGERLIIHQGLKPPSHPSALEPMGDWRVRFSPVRGYALHDSRGPVDGFRSMPLGAVVASCTLAACLPMVGVGERPDQAELLVTQTVLHLYRNADQDVPDDVTDQMPYVDFQPGRWAWILEDVQPTTERCPACWGTGERQVVYTQEMADKRAESEWARFTEDYAIGSTVTVSPCPTTCDPIPARGRQRIWWWEP